MNFKQYKEAVNTLNKWAYHYYTLDDPIATDEEYDKLYFEVVDFEKENPSKIDKNSPTQRVGDRLLEGFEKSSHIEKMYSLDDIFSEEELIDWFSKLPNGVEVYEEPKYDGLSLNILYEKGSFVKATTRGDGEIGEDVSENIPYIKGIPLTIPYTGKIEIRGEVIIMKADFPTINEERLASGEKAFSNERNAAAGSLRSFESSKVKMARLHFTPYGIGYSDKRFSKQTEIYQFILDQGFTNWGTNEIEVFSSAEEIMERYNSMIKNRDKYPMLLDGMVIKVNDLHMQEDLGFTSKYPKWAIAFKFPAIEKVTTLKDVILQVGKTGVITPVAIVDPVNIDGVVVERATLHNFSEIKEKDIRIGDSVVIIRSGDVIPKIIKVFHDRRTGQEIEISEPSECPACGSNVVKDKLFGTDKEATAVKCSNPNCPEVLKQRLQYAVGKKALDIKNLGESTINELVEKQFVQTLADLWTLDKEDFLSLEGFKEKKASKSLEAIQGAIGVDLYRFINALGIELIGERASKKLVEAFGEKLFSDLTEEEVAAVEDIGEAMAFNFVDFMSKNKEEIEELRRIIQPKIPEKKEVVESALTGKTVVITGTLSQSRGHFASLVEERGGKVGSSVSKKTDYVLAGENAGSKLDKAQKLGITILTEEEFNALL